MEYHSRLMYALIEISSKDDVDYKIAKKIIEYINKNHSPSLKELSNSSFVSNATINRFCKRIKITGFKELKSLISLEIAFSSNISNKNINVDLPKFYGEINGMIAQTWEKNYVSISEILKLKKNKNSKVHILATNNYLNYAKILEVIIQKYNNYVTIFNENAEWEKSNEIPADFVIAITYSSDRKGIIDLLKNKKNINKRAEYILLSSLNPFHNNENHIHHLNILGKNDKFETPNTLTRKSLNSIIDMLEYFFSKK